MRTMVACLLCTGGIAAATTAAAGSLSLLAPVPAEQSSCRRHAIPPELPPPRSLHILEAEVVPAGQKPFPAPLLHVAATLVSPCSHLPGGFADFTAQFHPNGRIRLASPEGDPHLGRVPTCILHHPLHHDLSLEETVQLRITLVDRVHELDSAPPR